MFSFTKKEEELLHKLNTPAKVQDFLNKIPFNFETSQEPFLRGMRSKETLKSPLFTLRERKAHCFEGSLLGAYILSLHGFKPYLMHLKATKGDYDHVVAPFKVGGLWGALSKTNHAVLRYREPIYRNIHELAMSYFHEYFLDTGEKTLRQYSALLHLDSFEKGWETMEGNLWGIDHELDQVKHFDFIPKSYLKKLRRADKIEIQAGKVVEYRK